MKDRFDGLGRVHRCGSEIMHSSWSRIVGCLSEHLMDHPRARGDVATYCYGKLLETVSDPYQITPIYCFGFCDNVTQVKHSKSVEDVCS